MTKKIFAGLIVLGIVSAVFGVLGPLHEVWHWLTAFLSGVDASIEWDRTYIDFPDVTLFIGFAGMFGEISILTLILFKLTSKKYFKLSVYIFGYSSSFIIIIISFFVLGFIPVDIEVMYGNYNHILVNIIFYAWMLYYASALWLQKMTIDYYKISIFPKLYVKKVKATLAYLEKCAQNRENRCKPLTLVK